MIRLAARRIAKYVISQNIVDCQITLDGVLASQRTAHIMGRKRKPLTLKFYALVAQKSI
jgi:hypothetical protein